MKLSINRIMSSILRTGVAAVTTAIVAAHYNYADAAVSKKLSELFYNGDSLGIDLGISGITFQKFMPESGGDEIALYAENSIVTAFVSLVNDKPTKVVVRFEDVGYLRSTSAPFGHSFSYQVSCNDFTPAFVCKASPNGFSGFALQSSGFAKSIMSSVEASFRVNLENPVQKPQPDPLMMVACRSGDPCSTIKRNEYDTYTYNPIPQLNFGITAGISGRSVGEQVVINTMEHHFYLYPNRPISEPNSLAMFVGALAFLALIKSSRNTDFRSK